MASIRDKAYGPTDDEGKKGSWVEGELGVEG